MAVFPIIPTDYDKATIRLMLSRDDLEITPGTKRRMGDDVWDGKDASGNTFTCDNDYDYGHIHITLNGKVVANFDKSFAEMEYTDCQNLVHEIYTKFTEIQQRDKERAAKTEALTKGLTPQEIQQLREKGLIR